MFVLPPGSRSLTFILNSDAVTCSWSDMDSSLLCGLASRHLEFAWFLHTSCQADALFQEAHDPRVMMPCVHCLQIWVTGHTSSTKSFTCWAMQKVYVHVPEKQMRWLPDAEKKTHKRRLHITSWTRVVEPLYWCIFLTFSPNQPSNRLAEVFETVFT